MSKHVLQRENPAIYEINTAAWLWELSQNLGRVITLKNIPAGEWDRLKAHGMDYVWLMGVWKRSRESCQICLTSSDLQASFEKALPGYHVQEVIGSPYAIQDYSPDPVLGTWNDLAKVKKELNQRGMGLVLDFVPNHTATDHVWIYEHPEYYIQGQETDYQNHPGDFFQVAVNNLPYYIAHGRDPNFPAWTDTAQLNLNNPATRLALKQEIGRISRYCDGIRCDMAMLVMNQIFQGVWGNLCRWPTPATEFWVDLIQSTSDRLWIAEAYWDTEWTLQQMGFDFVYDKRLYDRLRYAQPREVFLHLQAELAYQSKLVRFIENHDELRSPEAFGREKVKMAAVLCSMLPGLKLYFHGQWEGRRIHLPVQLQHTKVETVDQQLADFYERLLAAVNDRIAHYGEWTLKTVYQHADNNYSSLIAYTRKGDDGIKLVIVNLSSQPAQGRIVFQDDILESRDYLFQDQLGDEEFIRKGVWMAHPGLIFELNAYKAYLFNIIQAER
jgi:glycosidase